MTVPEGVQVLKDDNDFILDGTTGTFTVTEGQKITFTFSNTAKGDITVNIS